MFCSILLAASMYVLTGGASVGKTTIINELEKRGEPVIHEAATDWIASRIEAGIAECWKEDDFIYNILLLQLERENHFLNSDGRVFIDRGIFDHHAYVMHLNLAGTKSLSLVNEGLEGIDMNQRYAAIFYIAPYKDDFSPTHTEIRRENSQEVGELQAALYAIYSRHKHFIIVPGNMSPEKRADFILEQIATIEQQ